MDIACKKSSRVLRRRRRQYRRQDELMLRRAVSQEFTITFVGGNPLLNFRLVPASSTTAIGWPLHRPYFTRFGRTASTSSANPS